MILYKAGINRSPLMAALCLLMVAVFWPLVPNSAILIALVVMILVASSFTLITVIDAAVLVVLISYWISGWFSSYRPASAVIVVSWLIAVAVYLLLRRRRETRLAVLRITAVLFSIYAAVALVRFTKSYQAWMALGFDRLIDFRAYVRPLPSTTYVSYYNAVAMLGFCLVLVTIELDSALVKWKRALYLVPLLGCFACVLLSFSRGVYLSFVVACLVTLWLRRTRPDRIVKASASFLLIAVVLGVLLPHLGRAMIDTASLWTSGTQRRSLQGRLSIEIVNLHLIMKHPLSGVGPGCRSDFASRTLSGTAEIVRLTKEHNTLITTGLENGITGVIGLGFLAFSVVRFLWSGQGRAKSPAVLFACVSLASYAQVENILVSGRIPIVCLMLLLACLEADDSHANRRWSSPEWLPKGICFALVAMMLAYFPVVADVEVRNAELMLLRTDAEEAQTNRRVLRTAFRTSDPYVDFVNLTLRPISPGPPRSWRALISGERALSATAEAEILADEEALRSFVNKEPNEDGAWENLSRLSALVGHPSIALIEAAKATSLNKNSASHYASLAFLQDCYGLGDLALDSMSKAIALDPRLLLSPLWQDISSHDPIAARKMLGTTLTALEGGKGDLSLNQARDARLSWILGSKQHALEKNEQVLSTLPILSGSWELRGEMLVDLNQAQEGESSFLKARFLQPADPLPAEKLVELYLRRGAVDKAAALSLEAFHLHLFRSTQHSLDVSWRYGIPRAISNDEVPVSWLLYISPSFDFNAVFIELSKLFQDKGDTDLAARFRELASRTKPVAKLRR